MIESVSPPVRFRPDVLALPPYRQGAHPTKPGFKLSSNENPFEPLPSVIEALHQFHEFNRYAAVAMPELRTQLAHQFGVTADEVHLGAGSVSILYQLVHAAAGPGDEYIFAWPSFEAYPALGIVPGATGVRVPLTERCEHDLDAMADAITPATRVIILCTPNNPTGTTIGREAFDRFMRRVPTDTLVVLDEAYREFVTDPTAVRGEEVIGTYSNLVLLRTFSKAYGLAGLRIGYGVGDPAIWAAAQATAIPLSVTGVAEAAALASLTPEAAKECQERIAQIVLRRDWLAGELRSLGVDVPAAHGNFVWIAQGACGIDAGALAAAFAESGTLVRAFSGSGLRISVGEPESLAVVIDIVRENISRSRETNSWPHAHTGVGNV